MTSWKEGWEGVLRSYLPMGNYHLGFKEINQEMVNVALIKKRWNQAKVPAFLYRYFPLIWEGKEIAHEFLTGKQLLTIGERTPCLRVELTWHESNS